MRLDRQPSDEELTRIGEEAAALLAEGRVAELVARFGYALAFDREPAAALRADLDACLEEAHEQPDRGVVVRVKHFKSDSLEIRAVVECECLVAGRHLIELDLVVSEAAGGVYVTIEGISRAEE